ncbi:MAG TPA: prenyltransferase/squalene oxidase repeat-containing protein, partial [Candidatus Binatia bacterium]|nr:prenyltransferase/squalene oxidase repeat-containing protein [Candidatus Binatia bacterium]
QFHTTSAVVMNERIVVDEVLAELRRRELPSGGWAGLRSSSRMALEATCLAALALGSQDSAFAGHAQDLLLRVQNSNGSWPVFLGDDQNGAWVTSLAVIVLRDLVSAIPARLQGIQWLVNCAGKESNWLWKWKFRTADRHVRFDPDKFGWPWIPDTVSWVVLTAFAVLALAQAPCSCGGLERVPLRLDRGIEMLIDRACPGGGWNAGNGVVYGVALAPHPDDTAIALLALSDRAQDPVVQSSVQWLERSAPTLAAPWSLAWSILALAAHRRAVGSLITSLVTLPDLLGVDDACSLALVCLAADYNNTLSALGVNI